MDRHLPLNTLSFSSLPTIAGMTAVCFQPHPSFFFLSILHPNDWPNLGLGLLSRVRMEITSHQRRGIVFSVIDRRTDGRTDGVCCEGQARSAKARCGILGYINRASEKVSFRFFSFLSFSCAGYRDGQETGRHGLWNYTDRLDLLG
jgi:hypothetical protein